MRNRWHNLFNDGMLKAGYNLVQTSDEIKTLFEEAGFVNVTTVNMKMPIGPCMFSFTDLLLPSVLSNSHCTTT